MSPAEDTALPQDLRIHDSFLEPLPPPLGFPAPSAALSQKAAAGPGEATAARGLRWRTLATAGMMLLGSLAASMTPVSGTPALASSQVTAQAHVQTPHREASVRGAGEAGTLHILDRFESPDAHGFAVAQAARQAGFHGPIQGIQIQGHADDGQAILASERQMNDPRATPAQFLAALDSYAVHKQAGVLHAATDAVRGLAEQGAHDGALNISRNSNQAELVQDAWNLFVEPKQPGTDAGLGNAIRAFGLDESRILSSDPAVAGPETIRLQQALVNRIDQAVDGSAEIRQARQQYEVAVQQLGKSSVSVVVSSGNEGELASRLVQAAYQAATPPKGAGLHLPPDFYDNPLSTSQTTTVGAVRFSGGSAPTVLPDSTPSHSVSLFADGEVALPDGTREHGTSFSAPVVGAALAHEHGLVENLSPRQAHSMLEQSLATREPGVPGPVVAPGRLSHFLDTARF